jgi:hypothetical protein
MSKVTIVIGILLIALGFFGYFGETDTAHRSPTAFIPSAVGAILLVCGLIVTAQPNLRKHIMHAAVAVALLGFLAAAGRVLMKTSQGAPPHGIAAFSLWTMIALTGIFVGLSVGSFINARRNPAPPA